MKTSIYCILVLFATISAFCQDQLVKRNGEELTVRLTEITDSTVSYKRLDNLEGPVFIAAKKEILFIRYANGTKEIFDENGQVKLTESAPVTIANPDAYTAPSRTVVPVTLSGREMNVQGMTDASRHYSRYTGAGTGTLLPSLLINGLVGLVPAAICSATPPKRHNLGYPSEELMRNDDYYRGYVQQARKMKSRKVWTNWGIGTVISTVVLIALNSQ